MRNKQELHVLLVMALLFLCVHRLSATNSLGTGIVENMKENDEERGRAIIIAQLNKFSHGYIGGGGNNGGHPVVSGGDGGVPAVSGGNGGSRSPNVRGGGGMTPLYAAAAGAGNNRHPHRGGGNRGKGGGVGLETLAITAFAWFVLMLCINQD